MTSRLVVCVGASKAGTTTLYSMMRAHPDVAVSRVKETAFFFADESYNKGFDWFLEHYFPDSARAKVIFEADNAYMAHPWCIQRIRDCAPDARIVAMLRHPVERAFSQYLFRRQMGRVKMSFEEHCEREAELISAGGSTINEHGYLERGRYGKYSEKILEIFPREQVRFIVFERFMADQAAEFTKLQQWLGLDPVNIEAAWENPTMQPRSKWLARLLYDPGRRGMRRRLGQVVAHPGLKKCLVSLANRVNLAHYAEDEKPRLDPSTRAALIGRLLPDIERTETLLGEDLSIWKV